MALLRTTRIEKGLYNVKKTNWYVEYDKTLDGENKWVIFSSDRNEMEEYYETGEDQLWFTKRAAIEQIEYFFANRQQLKQML